jgi:ribosomal protein S18 acetylase RimI-like enzyme
MPSRSLPSATTGSSAGAGASVSTQSASRRGISHRAVKEDRVRTGRAHAALVLDQNGTAQGWCQYGSPEELPSIKRKREYDKDAPPHPHWRITCFYVGTKHRGHGIARAALEGALDQIAQAGGGLVEAIPEVTTGRAAQGRFLYSATVELFEQYGFHPRPARRQARLDREQDGRSDTSA